MGGPAVAAGAGPPAVNRLLLACAFVALAVVTTASAFVFAGSVSLAELLTNLGAELFGIALVVAVVDWLIERNKLREEAQRIAWSTLHDLDHAVWVWQGGRREFHLDELVALLDLVGPTDPMPPFTQTLLANLGIRASDALRLQSRVFRTHRRLRHAMQCLAGLGQIRELGSLMPPQAVVETIRAAIVDLAAVTEQPVHPGSFGVARKFRDPSVSAQEERYRGAQQEPSVVSWAIPGSRSPAPQAGSRL